MIALRGMKDNGESIAEDFADLDELNARWTEYQEAGCTLFNARAYNNDESLDLVCGEWR